MRNSEHDIGLFDAHAGEESKLDRLGLSGIDLSRPQGLPALPFQFDKAIPVGNVNRSKCIRGKQAAA